MTGNRRALSQDQYLHSARHPVFEKTHHLYAPVGWLESVLGAADSRHFHTRGGKKKNHDVSCSPPLQAKDDTLIS